MVLAPSAIQNMPAYLRDGAKVVRLYALGCVHQETIVVPGFQTREIPDKAINTDSAKSLTTRGR